MSNKQMRAEFEKAINDARFFPAELCFAMTKSPSGKDEYANSHLQSCWVGWQAACKSRATSGAASGEVVAIQAALDAEAELGAKYKELAWQAARQSAMASERLGRIMKWLRQLPQDDNVTAAIINIRIAQGYLAPAHAGPATWATRHSPAPAFFWKPDYDGLLFATPSEQSAPPVPPMDQSSCIPPFAEPASQPDADDVTCDQCIELEGALHREYVRQAIAGIRKAAVGLMRHEFKNGLEAACEQMESALNLNDEPSSMAGAAKGGITIKTWQERKGYGPKTTVGIKDVDDEIAELRAALLATQSASTAPGQAETERDAARYRFWRERATFGWRSWSDNTLDEDGQYIEFSANTVPGSFVDRFKVTPDNSAAMADLATDELIAALSKEKP